jgi:hypothetical protein
MTLLERRKMQLDVAITELLVRAEALRVARDQGYSDVTSIVRMVADQALRAESYAALVDDLADVEKYGPGGGR